MAAQKGACRDTCEALAAEWPRGAVVTPTVLDRAVELGANLHWAAEHMLSPVARTAYKAIERPAWDAYRAIQWPALEAYEAIQRSAWDAYVVIRQPALDAYWAIRQPAWDAYEAIRQPAMDAYLAKKKEAFWCAWQIDFPD